MDCRSSQVNLGQLAFSGAVAVNAPAFNVPYFPPDAFLDYRKNQQGCTAIQLPALADTGFKAIILDLDKTLRPYSVSRYFSTPPEIPQPVLDWLKQAKSLGFKLYIISNNLNKRDVGTVSRQLQIPAIACALKPWSFWNMRKALHQMGVRKDETLMVGDKSHVDGIYGSLNGIRTVIVPPLVV